MEGGARRLGVDCQNVTKTTDSDLVQAGLDYLYAQWQRLDDPWPRMAELDARPDAVRQVHELAELNSISEEAAWQLYRFYMEVAIQWNRSPSHDSIREWIADAQRGRPPSAGRRRLARRIAETAGVSERSAYRHLRETLPDETEMRDSDRREVFRRIATALIDVVAWASATHTRRMRRAELRAGGRKGTTAAQWDIRHPTKPVESAPPPRKRAADFAAKGLDPSGPS